MSPNMHHARQEEEIQEAIQAPPAQVHDEEAQQAPHHLLEEHLVNNPEQAVANVTIPICNYMFIPAQFSNMMSLAAENPLLNPRFIAAEVSHVLNALNLGNDEDRSFRHALRLTQLRLTLKLLCTRCICHNPSMRSSAIYCRPQLPL